MKDLELHIDEIVLHGLDPGDHRLLQRAVQHELARLLRGQPELAQRLTQERRSGEPRAPGSAIQVGPEMGPERVGQQVAQAVFGQLAGTPNKQGRG